jgi:hypothetical protein
MSDRLVRPTAGATGNHYPERSPIIIPSKSGLNQFPNAVVAGYGPVATGRVESLTQPLHEPG